MVFSKKREIDITQQIDRYNCMHGAHLTSFIYICIYISYMQEPGLNFNYKFTTHIYIIYMHGKTHMWLMQCCMHAAYMNEMLPLISIQ